MNRKPLECDQAELFISLNVDGEPLPKGGESRLQAHLASCPSCRRILITERNQSETLRAAIRCETIPSTLSPTGTTTLEQFAADLAREAQTKPSRGVYVFGGGRTAWTLVAAAAALVLGFGLWLLSDSGPGNPNGQTRQPWAPEIVFQEEANDLDRVPTSDGSPWGVETRRWREFILRPDRNREAHKGGLLEVERIEKHPVKLIRWDYK